MPMITPRKGEKKKAFIERFMGDKKMVDEFPNRSQRYAVAISLWEGRKKKKSKRKEKVVKRRRN